MQIKKKYASNRFVDQTGAIHGSTIMTLSTDHTLHTIQPLEGKEEPFTEWIGGTVIASPCESLSIPSPSNYTTLKDWIEKLTALDSQKHTNLYLWHTPITTLDSLCPSPVRLY